MSRRNKVNPDHYTIAGRLAPDDWARERRKQSEQLYGATRGRQQKPTPPWMTAEASANAANENRGDELDTTADEAEPIESEDAVSLNEGDSGEAAQQPQAKPRGTVRGKEQSGRNQQKTERRRREARKQETKAGTTRGARSATAKPRTTPKASGARGTPRGGKAPKARGSAARAASPQRAGKPAARKTAARGTRKATAKQGTRTPARGAKKTAAKAKKAKKAKKR
jgi:DNA end-binding protein Ku